MKKFVRLNVVLIVAVLIAAFSGCSEEVRPEVFHAKGTVVAVEKEKGVVTIDHREIKGLMSAMTMDFKAKDKKLLEDIKKDDPVEFSLSKFGEKIEIVAIKRAGENKAHGATVYKDNCAKCHGDKGEGKKKGIPLIEGHALGHPEEDFLKQVRNGGEKMPAFAEKLSEKEIEAVVRYVRNEIQKGLRKDGVHEH
ncbi:MAG: copper-binding protein [Acidobacteriota bacterium]|nr:copper-binding protein [Acidobacteriota bacterium]MDH3530351.1 copper-binding protein [Acidobacteriota bacterium]